MKDLLETIPQQGKIEWIGLRVQRKGDVLSVENVEINQDEGLIGDHYSGKSKKRQVTLIQKEHLDTISSILQKEVVPELLRRNIVVSGINLLSLKDKRFMIGKDIILEYTGPCHPCSRMEKNLGPGGYNAVRGHGGITAKVIEGGQAKVGDSVKYNKEVINNGE